MPIDWHPSDTDVLGNGFSDGIPALFGNWDAGCKTLDSEGDWGGVGLGVFGFCVSFSLIMIALILFISFKSLTFF